MDEKICRTCRWWAESGESGARGAIGLCASQLSRCDASYGDHSCESWLAKLTKPTGSSEIVQYEHYDRVVSVRADLKGRHREHCLCWRCEFFEPGSDDNCKIANLLYSICCQFAIVTPVWECPTFQEKQK